MLNFSCNGCGKCCHQGISLSLNEFFTHSIYFPMEVYFRLSQINDLNDRVRGEDSGEFKVFLGDKEYAVIPEIISTNDDIACINLMDDNLCGIYEDRPDICRLFPIPLGVKTHNLSAGISMHKDSELKLSADKRCEGWTEEGDPILIKGVIADKDWRDMHKKTLSEQYLKKVVLKDFFSLENISNAAKEKLINAENVTMAVGIFAFIEFLFDTSAIDTSDKDRLCKDQILSHQNLIANAKGSTGEKELRSVRNSNLVIKRLNEMLIEG